MLRKLGIFAIFAVVAGLALATAGSSSASTGPTEASLSDSSALAPQTTIVDSSGDYIVSSAAPDSTAALTLGSDGYPCADVGYRATVKWYQAITHWVSWTWTMHFGVHVCHDKVQYVTHLYNTVDSIMATISWCGVVAKNWGPSLPYTSAHSYMEGCFDMFDKIAVTWLPWARITIGGNGGLWARSTGVN